MSDDETALPVFRHFALQRLASGVYAAVLPDHMACIAANANAGIVDLGDRTLVFDTFMTPGAAAELSAAALELTGRPADYVVNGHYHYDHIRGNQVFPAHAQVISTTVTRELMATRGVESIRRDTLASVTSLLDQEDRIAGEPDPAQQEWLRIEAAEARAIRESLPILSLRLPDVTFDSRLALHGSRRSAHVVTLGGGHTWSDAFLVLPGEGIAFLGDLLFVGHHPYLGHGDPRVLDRILAGVQEMGVETVVPGHGPVGTTADLHQMREYLAALERFVDTVFRAGGSADDAARLPVPAPFAGWRFGFFFADNLRFMYERLSSEAAALPAA